MNSVLAGRDSLELQTFFLLAVVYVAPAVLIVMAYQYFQASKSRKALQVYNESVATGMTEPSSLHPVINNIRCLGCATCVAACPEKSVLGIIENRAHLISPSSCIGHGACKTACPTQAIELVFGTSSRGMDIPHVGPDFQTNIQGIYIAGELGGMGLIRNAIEQGRQAIASIANGQLRGQDGQVDVLIVGAGPSGISAGMAAAEQGLSYVVLEQDSIGGTIAHYPRGKVVMTAPAELPLIGKFKFTEASKEELMVFWRDVVEKTNLNIFTGESVVDIKADGIGFQVKASRVYRAANILLAIGRRGTPRKLGIPGEDKSKVVYRLVDPEQYRDKNVVVVGGGDSAIEAAISLSEETVASVLLSYRGDSFSRAKAKNRAQLERGQKAGRIRVELSSQLINISENTVRLSSGGAKTDIPNDAVIVCAGGILPTAFLESVGIQVDTKYGTV